MRGSDGGASRWDALWCMPLCPPAQSPETRGGARSRIAHDASAFGQCVDQTEAIALFFELAQDPTAHLGARTQKVGRSQGAIPLYDLRDRQCTYSRDTHTPHTSRVALLYSAAELGYTFQNCSNARGCHQRAARHMLSC